MSGWTKREIGDVQAIHHSTSSQIELKITQEIGDGSGESATQTIWMDYKTFEDLKAVVSSIDFP